MKFKLIACVVFILATIRGLAQPDDLMIVEYADWNSGGGLLVEIYNPTCDTIDLSVYKVALYEDGATNPFGGTAYPLKGYLAPKTTLIIRNIATTPSGFTSCMADSTVQMLGLTGNAAFVLSKGNSLTNFVDIVGAYGANLCITLPPPKCAAYSEPTPKTGGVTQALFRNRVVRDTNNFIRYTSINGTSKNSWPHDTGTNLPGWTSGGAGTCVAKGFTSFLAPMKPEIQGDSFAEFCSGTDTAYEVLSFNGGKYKWVLKGSAGSTITGADSNASVAIHLGNAAGYDTLIVYNYTTCATGGQVVTDTAIIKVNNCAKGCIVINEIMVQPTANNNAGGGFAGEWLELFNTCCDTVDIGCYRISGGEWGLTIPEGTQILPFGLFTIGSDSTSEGTPDLNISTCNCLASSLSTPAYGTFADGAGQVILYDTAGNPQDALVWGGGAGLPTTQPAPTLGACNGKTLALPANTAGKYQDIGTISVGVSKARSADGGSVWTDKTGADITFKNSNDGGLVTATIQNNLHDTLYACGQQYYITTQHTGTGQPAWVLQNGNTTGTTFSTSSAGDSIWVTAGNTQGIDTFIVTKNTPGCYPVYDTVYRVLLPCLCHWITQPVADTSVCINNSVGFSSSDKVDWFYSAGSMLTAIATDTTNISRFSATAKTDTIVAVYKNCPDTAKATFNNLPVITGLVDTSACLGDSVAITPSISPNTTFTWAPTAGLGNSSQLHPKAGPATTTKYLLSIVDTATGCATADSFVFTVNPKPTVTGLAGQTICMGDSVLLSPSITNFSTINWKPAIGLSCPTCLQTYAKPVASTLYTVIATSSGNCTDSQSVNVTVVPIPTANAGLGDTICPGESTILTATGGGSYEWGTGDTTASITVFPSATGYYHVRTRAGSCYSPYDSVLVVISPLPQASFTATPTEGQAPLEVVFTNTSKQAAKYGWLTGTTPFSIDSEPTLTITDTGSHIITLIATNNQGCADTAILVINVYSESYISIPNVFTPNRDNINDYFEILFSGMQKLSGSIYNRWGEELHRFEYPANNWWDGTYRGLPCPEGVYFCLLSYLDAAGKSHKYNGTLTLMR